jgi:hypothetical protein
MVNTERRIHREKDRMKIYGVLCALCCWALATSAQEAPMDVAHLRVVEDHTENLANELHKFSVAVRDGQSAEMASYFAADLKAERLPSAQGDWQQVAKWIYEQPTARQKEYTDKEGFLVDWQQFLAEFSHIEDVRFKVKYAQIEVDASVDAEVDIYFFVVGRDVEGRRQWVESKGHISAREVGEKKWQIRALKFKYLHKHHTRTDLFSEVSLAAQVYRSVPPFGTPGNQDFVAHGVTVGDLDQDGLLDVITTGTNQNYAYMNQGDGTFENRAAEIGLEFTPTATAPLLIDYDNDGDSDLFMASVGHQMLFENRLYPDGKLDFWDVSSAAGVAYPAQGFSAVAGDVNNDGLVDIYVASYNQYGTIMPNSWSQATNGTANLLFINQGAGRFVEAAEKWGVQDRRWSYAAHFGDLNADGRADLYVANDFGENAFYINEGDRFVDRAAAMGVLDPGNGMGVSFGDYNNDGMLDLHVTNMSSTAGNRIIKQLFPNEATQLDETRVLNKLAAGNSLYENLGDGQFKDVTAKVGALSAGWSFGGGFIDFDNDGWEDIHAPNGFISGKSLKDT